MQQQLTIADWSIEKRAALLGNRALKGDYCSKHVSAFSLFQIEGNPVGFLIPFNPPTRVPQNESQGWT